MAQDSGAGGTPCTVARSWEDAWPSAPSPGPGTLHPSLHSPWHESTSRLGAQLPQLPCACSGTGWKPAPVCEHLWHHWLQEVWREAELGTVSVA